MKNFDVKTFITIITMLLFAYCVVLQIEIPEDLKYLVYMVVGVFLGVKINKVDVS